MTLSFELDKTLASQILTKAIDVSGINQLTTVIPVSDGRDVLTYDLALQDAIFDNPAGDKAEDDGGIDAVDIQMYDLYKILSFRDWVPDAAEGLMAQIQTQMGQKLGETIQKAVFGKDVIKSSPWPGFGTPVEVDTTDPAALAALVDPNANGWIFNKSVKPDLTAAYTKGTTTNVLSASIADGAIVSGVPAYFSSLGVDPTVVAGVVGDFSRCAFAYDTNLKLRVLTPDTSFTLAQHDATAFVIKMRCGFAIAPGAASSFKAFKKKAASTDATTTPAK